jgi:hypothetical protein
MAEHNGGGEAMTAQEAIASGGHPSSLDGFAAAEPVSPLDEHPELLLAGAFFAGALVGAIVGRRGR